MGYLETRMSRWGVSISVYVSFLTRSEEKMARQMLSLQLNRPNTFDQDLRKMLSSA